MDAELKCVSYETAVKLKEAGFPQETERWWWQDDCGDYTLYYEEELPDTPKTPIEPDRFVAAPDAQEIGELLPHSWNSGRSGEGYACFDGNENTEKKQVPFLGMNESEAHASCWLWLREQKLI